MLTLNFILIEIRRVMKKTQLKNHENSALEKKSDKRRTTHTTNPHQSKVGSRKTDDR